MDEDFNKKQEQLVQQAEKLQHDNRIQAQRAEVKRLEALVKEAKEDAEEAAAQDGPRVSVSEGGAEAVRTRTLLEQHEGELETAKQALADLEAGREPANPAIPVTGGIPSAGSAAAETSNSSDQSATETRTSGAVAPAATRAGTRATRG